ncbi:hypothetical protein HaLaN_05350, partial [Haematococcus lacustris]
MREEILQLAGPAYTSRVQPGVYVRRLEAACQLLHRKLQPSSIAAAQTDSSRPAAHNDPPAGAPPTPSAAGNTTAVELCTLLLTDQEVLDVVLALHDIRIAQYSELLPWSRHRHTLYLPMPSESLDQQLRHSQRSVPGSQLSRFISRLEHATRMELNGVDQLLTRLHATLPGLLLGLSTAVSVMQAAGHPEAQAHRLLLLRCILHMGPLQLRMMAEMGWYNTKDIKEQLDVKPTTSCPDHLARLLASSPAVTGWPGPLPAKLSPMNSNSTAAARQESWNELQADASCLATAALRVMAGEYHCLKYMARILSAASAPSHLGVVAPGHQTTPLSASSSPLLSVVLSVLPRSLVLLQCTVAAVRLGATLDNRFTPDEFPGCFRDSYTLLCEVLRLMVELWPDVRCRPAMLRLLVRTAAVGADGYSTLAMLVDGAPDYKAETRLLSGLMRTPELKARTPELKDILLDTLDRVCSVWVTLLMPHCEAEPLSDMRIRLNECHQQGQNATGSAACGRKEVHKQPPSAQQLAPLALDLVWGMDGMLQDSSMREELLRLAGPAYTSRVQPGVYVRRLEAACQLLHRKLQPSSIAAAQTASSCPLPHIAPSAVPPTPSAAGNTAAVELCTLLLTDQEVLDVVLALHDIRTAQLCNLLPFTRAHLPPPVSSGAFARRLSQRQRSASGDQLNLFVEALGRDTIVE